MRARWLLATVILGVSFVAAYLGGLAARTAKQSPQMVVIEGLAVSPTDLDLGEVWEEQGIAWRLPIHNQTPGRIEIHDIQQTCGCTEIKPRRLSIAAGETATIDLTLDLTHRTYSISDKHDGHSRLRFSRFSIRRVGPERAGNCTARL